ncbi:MAG: hypothetical protein ACON38_06335 [Akkermansiaceae bacterium]
MKEPWSIKTRAKECTLSGTPFEADQKIRAAIFPDPESSGYLRKDYTLEAWDEREDDETPFSTWITTYQPPVIEEKVEDVVEEDPETLLRRMVEEDEEHTENARYILAVMLERQKLLRETDTQEIPSGILRVYEHRKTGDVFIIKDPGIALSEVEQVQDEVRALLDPDSVESEEDESSDETETVSQDAPSDDTPDESGSDNDDEKVTAPEREVSEDPELPPSTDEEE